jgi:hypothetical protein
MNIKSSSGFMGVNTTNPSAPLSVHGAMSHSITTTTSNLTVDILNYTVLGDTTTGNITITLPLNSSAITGRMYKFKNIGGNNLIIVPNVDGGLIDGAGNMTLPTGLGLSSSIATLQSDGINWWFV